MTAPTTTEPITSYTSPPQPETAGTAGSPGIAGASGLSQGGTPGHPTGDQPRTATRKAQQFDVRKWKQYLTFLALACKCRAALTELQQPHLDIFSCM